MTLWLTDSEIADLCDGLTQPAAQARYLRENFGLTVGIKPSGRPVVVRSHAEAVLSGHPEAPKGATSSPAATKTQPNRAALLNLVGTRFNGPQTLHQPA